MAKYAGMVSQVKHERLKTRARNLQKKLNDVIAHNVDLRQELERQKPTIDACRLLVDRIARAVADELGDRNY
jgi:hypothetical protein